MSSSSGRMPASRPDISTWKDTSMTTTRSRSNGGRTRPTSGRLAAAAVDEVQGATETPKPTETEPVEKAEPESTEADTAAAAEEPTDVAAPLAVVAPIEPAVPGGSGVELAEPLTFAGIEWTAEDADPCGSPIGVALALEMAGDRG